MRTRADTIDTAAQPSNLRLFRQTSLVVSFAVGLQPLVRLWALGPQALPHLHLPVLIDLLMTFAGPGRTSPSVLANVFIAIIAAYVLGLVAFMGALARRTDASRTLSPFMARGLLAAQIVLGLLIAPEWLYVVAAELALLLPVRSASRWWCAQVLGYAALRLSRLAYVHAPLLVCNLSGAPLPLAPQQRVDDILLDTVSGVVFQALAFGVGYLAAAERRRRGRVALAHAELVATRRLLGDAAAASERTRITRELHDSIGHQLTAMKLHLDLAVRQSGSSVAAPLKAACELAQALLAEVRAVVSAEGIHDASAR